MTPTGFVKWLLPYAKAVQARTGILAKFMIAQAALETAWGSRICTDHETGVGSNNLFNIKAGSSWLGPVVRVWTHEYHGGQRVSEEAEFRAYRTPEESFEDYARLITRASRYQKAMAVAGDIAKFAQALQDAGYATDPRYARKILDIADQLYLKGFEE